MIFFQICLLCDVYQEFLFNFCPKFVKRTPFLESKHAESCSNIPVKSESSCMDSLACEQEIFTHNQDIVERHKRNVSVT